MRAVEEKGGRRNEVAEWKEEEEEEAWEREIDLRIGVGRGELS